MMPLLGRFQSLCSGSLGFAVPKPRRLGLQSLRVSLFHTALLTHQPSTKHFSSPTVLQESSIPLCSKGISFFGFSNLLSLRAIHVGITHHLS